MLHRLWGSFVLHAVIISWACAQQIPLEDLLAKARLAEDRYHYEEALSLYKQALAADNTNANIHAAIARQLIGLERLEESKDVLLTAVTLNPAHAEAQTMLGVYYQKIVNDFALAERHYKLAIDADPSYVRPQNLLGEYYLSVQRLDEAREIYERLCLNAPDAFESHFGLGNVAVKQNKNEEAVRELTHAIEITPGDPEPYRLLGQALAKLGKRDDAQKALKQYQKVKEEANALMWLLRGVRRNPNDADNWFQLGGHYFRHREERKAIDAFMRGLELEPGRKAIYGYIGVLYLRLKEPVAAEDYLKRAIELDPNHAEHYNNLGVCYMFQKQYKKAADMLKKSIDLGHKDPRVKQNYQAALKKAGIIEPATKKSQ